MTVAQDKQLDKTVTEQASRDVGVRISNTSGTVCYINDFSLTGGSWKSIPPAGQAINPGDDVEYHNFTDTPYTNLGGTMNLTTATGGKITIQWNWAWGSLITGSATGTSLQGMAVSSYFVNRNLSTPELVTVLTNAPSA